MDVPAALDAAAARLMENPTGEGRNAEIMKRSLQGLSKISGSWRPFIYYIKW